MKQAPFSPQMQGGGKRRRADKRNVVIDLNPEGYQLLKLKELITSFTSLGGRKEFVAAFWQYVLWLEIAYKLLEKDAHVAQRDHVLGERYRRLEAMFRQRADTGTRDFSERLRLLTDKIAERFEAHQNKDSLLKSSEVLQIIYGTEIMSVRNEIFSYLKLKGTILLLFDNLDRMRTLAGFDQHDATILMGLVESLQEISKPFRRNNLDFCWVVFIRSDVYLFVVQAMADYGKHEPLSLEWTDRELLKRVLQKRILASLPDRRSDWAETWRSVSTATTAGRDTMDFLCESSLMRPRYLIRLFESAKRRAINLGRMKILEEDYQWALEEIGWTVIEDLDFELSDVVPNTRQLVFDLAQLNGACGLPELRDAISNRVGATKVVERVMEVLLWSGSVGIKHSSSAATFIYDCGYKLAHLKSLIHLNPHAEVCLHPTLAQLHTRKGAGAEL
jgi:hypothetical protein